LTTIDVSLLRCPARTWVGLSALLAGGSLLAWWLPAPGLDWQPELALAQPWRAWTAVFVHWSPLHLGANLTAAAVVAAYGVAARVPTRMALAWAAAWPLTQFGLLWQPALAHYGGLSGMLHAGVAISSLWLVWAEKGRRRTIGAAVFIGMVIKLLSETPWGTPLRHSPEWDIAVAPLAHATGALAGLACAALALAWPAQSRA
jgi:rhomboid family GlyGly-CTERM serine protease